MWHSYPWVRFHRDPVRYCQDAALQVIGSQRQSVQTKKKSQLMRHRVGRDKAMTDRMTSGYGFVSQAPGRIA